LSSQRNKVTEDLLDAATQLKVVGRAGIGLDNVDIPAATKRGIIVMNTPEGNVITTAEHTIALMLSLTRNIPLGTSSLKAGQWDKKKLQGREIYKKVLGIIGFGKNWFHRSQSRRRTEDAGNCL